MALEKAKLVVETEHGKEEIPVQFNPSEYQLTDSVRYKEDQVPNAEGPVTHFVSRGPSTLNLSLTFDTFDTPENGVRVTDMSLSQKSRTGSGGMKDLKEHEPTDVSKLTRKVAKMLDVDGQLHRPPTVTFVWGAIHFKGVAISLKQHFTMFMPNGMPVRARLELTLKSIIEDDSKKRESPFESPDRTKFRTVHEGEQLWNFAAQEYGDAELWRVIARENGLLDPLDLQPGQIIKLPAL